MAAIDAQERAWAGLASTGTCPATSAFDNAWESQWFGSILFDDGSSLSNTGCDYTVSIEWEEDRYVTDETGDAFVYRFRLPEL
ncbi:hypothetical protein ACOJCM_11220 [Billgrantia sp. LNSP4103-1]